MTSTKRSTEDMDRAIGLKVRTARGELQMSQDKLGQALGLTFQQVQKYEKGTNRISTSTLLRIAVILQKPMTYFIAEPKYKPNTKGEEMAEFVASRIGTQLIGAAMELPPHLQQSLLDLARSMNKAAA
jgi:transcriptional regulator with XRE-family HTH domain